MRKLFVEVAAQAVELFRLAQILGADCLVELRSEWPIVRSARLVALIARPPRFGSGFRVAHLGIVGHVGGRRIDGLRRAVGQLLGRRFRLHAHALGVGGIGSVAVLTLFVLPVVFVAFFAFLFVGLARAILTHVQAI